MFHEVWDQTDPPSGLGRISVHFLALNIYVLSHNAFPRASSPQNTTGVLFEWCGIVWDAENWGPNNCYSYLLEGRIYLPVPSYLGSCEDPSFWGCCTKLDLCGCDSVLICEYARYITEDGLVNRVQCLLVQAQARGRGEHAPTAAVAHWANQPPNLIFYLDCANMKYLAYKIVAGKQIEL